MKAGKTIRTFSAKNGSSVIVRLPRWDDLDGLLELINSLVEEGAEISRAETVSREEEIDWLSSLLGRIEKGKAFLVVAEVDGSIVASSDITQLKGRESHVAVIGIVVKKGFRDIGIGTKIMETLVDNAREMELKVLTLSVFASNKRALHVYEKVGFVKTGSIPKKHFKDGMYVDEVIMIKVLE